MKHLTIFTFVIAAIIAITFIVIIIPTQLNATSSYKASMSFFQGFDLERGVVNEGIQDLLSNGTESPNVIRLVFVTEDIEPAQIAYSFDPSTDFQIGHDAENDFFGIVPMDLTAFALMNGHSFDSVHSPNLNALQLWSDSIEIKFDDPSYTIVVFTNENNIFKIGNFQLNGSKVDFDYEKIEVNATIPEPSTLILFGFGLLGIGGIVAKKFFIASE